MSTVSVSTYMEVVDKLPQKRGLVFAQFVSRSWTIGELQELYRGRMGPGAVTGRVSELADAGLIFDSGLVRGGQTVWTRTAEHLVDEAARLRKAKRRVEADISRFVRVGNGVEFTVFVPNEVYERVKTSKRMRFL